MPQFHRLTGLWLGIHIGMVEEVIKLNPVFCIAPQHAHQQVLQLR